MRSIAALAIFSLVATSAQADIIAGGAGDAGTLYQLTASDLVDLGDGLWGTTLSIENLSGNADFDVNSVEIALGTNGSLHNEQAFGGFGATPTLEAYNALPGAADASRDSHFLPTVSLALAEPAEEGTLSDSGRGTTLQGGVAGFGLALSGNFGFNSGSVIPLAYLVVEGPANEIAIDYAVFANDADPGSNGERFAGSIVGIPEPSTVLMAGLALVGFVARRK